ncbi:MAG: pilus assembly PilX N-terminal domain-containing protein [Desulfohalobiaceae bacterium]|nr:pilus assembly PilX N-terminal domain-containing protein [Desulfohalobiaceae bacterium]
MKDLLDTMKKEEGAALPSSLMFLIILSLLGSTFLLLTRTDLHIGSNHRANAHAFYQANAGVNHTLAKIEAELQNSNSTFALPATLGAASTLSYSQPSGFSFTISSITKVADLEYAFRSTGSGPKSSKSILDVTFARDPAINFAVFGDKKVDVGNTAGIYSYDSSVVTNPSPANSTGQGNTGSNESVILRNSCVVDGDVALGEDPLGNDGRLTDHGGIVSGTNGEDIERIDPDPLGVVDGEYAPNFTSYRITNDNSNGTFPSGAITGDDLTLGNGQNATLPGKPGGANYYFHDIRLANSATLNIDTSSGPAYIYLTGEIDAVTGSNFKNTDAGATGRPRDFSIFANSQNDTDKISIGNDVEFSGLIYAPYITVRMDNSADIYGAILAHETEIINSVDIYFDIGITNEYISKNISLTSWRDLHGPL